MDEKQEKLKELILKSLKAPRKRMMTLNVRAHEDDEDDNDRTFSVSSNEPDLRYLSSGDFFGPANEILSHKKGAVNLERFDNGANILLDHDPTKVVGVIEEARTVRGKKLDVDMRFSRNPQAQETKIDVDDKIRRNVSIGYTVQALKERTDIQNPNGFPTFEATAWTPAEASFVGVPADASVGPGRELEQIIRRDFGIENMDEDTFAELYRDTLELAQKEVSTLNEKGDIVIEEGDKEIETKAVSDSDELLETKQMEKETMTETVDKTPDATVGVDHEVRKAAVELQRVRDIRALARANKVDADTEDQWVVEGRSADSVGRLILERDGDTEEIVGAGDVTLTDRETQQYSILNVVRNLTLGVRSGIEFDISDEIAKKLGKDTPGFYMPMGMSAGSFNLGKRQISTTPDSLGGSLVFDQPGSLIELLRPRMRVVQLGAQTISGLTAPLTLPRMTGSAGLEWIPEGDPTGKGATEPGFDTVPLTPKQAIMRTGVTKQQLVSANEDVEGIVREDFLDSLAIGLDEAAISGTVAADTSTPTGILSTPAVSGQSTIGTLATFSFASVVDLETTARVNNSPDGRGGYLTTHQVIGLGKQTEKAATTAQFVIDNGQANGFPIVGSNNVTSGISGSLGESGHATIYSPDWSQLVIADWGAIEILVDPFTLKHRGIVELNGTLLADVALRHPEVFTVTAYDLS